MSAAWFSKYHDPKLNRIYTTFGSPELDVYGIFTPFYNELQIGTLTDINVNSGYYYNNLPSKILGFGVEKTSTGVSIGKINQTIENDQLNNYNKIYSSSTDDIYIIR